MEKYGRHLPSLSNSDIAVYNEIDYSKRSNLLYGYWMLEVITVDPYRLIELRTNSTKLDLISQ